MSDKPKAQTSLVLTSDDCEMDDDKVASRSSSLAGRRLTCTVSLKIVAAGIPNSHIWVLGSEKSVASQKTHRY